MPGPAAGLLGHRQHRRFAAWELVLFKQTFYLGWDMLPDGNFHGWRILFLVGTLPALLVVVVMLYIREPESWLAAREAARHAAADRARR